MILATTGDIAAAMILLSVLEGFRRVPEGDFVITLWRGRWRHYSSPTSVWFRRLRWLWLFTLQFQPRTFSCAFAPPLAKAAKPHHPVGYAIESHKEKFRALGWVTICQFVLVFLLLPFAATMSSALAYGTLILIIALGGAIAALSWRFRRWDVVKYVAYPPSSLFAVADQTIDALRGYRCDEVTVALLDGSERNSLLRRYYRTAVFGSDQSDTDSQAIRRDASELLAPHGLQISEFLDDPIKSYSGARSFCPCCETEFVIDNGECTDCCHVRLIPFKL